MKHDLRSPQGHENSDPIACPRAFHRGARRGRREHSIAQRARVLGGERLLSAKPNAVASSAILFRP